MKTTMFNLTLVLALTGIRALAAPEVFIGVSPYLSSEQRQALQAAVRDFALKTAPLGTRIVLWDAWSLTILVTLDVPPPSVIKKDSLAARVIRVKPALDRLAAWAAAAQPGDALRDSAAIRAPEWLQEASGFTQSGDFRVFILIGSPLYRSPSEPTFDMAEDARFPSDGHLALSLRDSVFGCAEKSNRLARTLVHWCIPDQSVWVNELHRYRVMRFWTLFVQVQGGVLATFSADLAAVFSRAFQTNLPPVLRVAVDPADEKPVMHSARPRTLPAWLEPIATPRTSVADPPPAARAADATPAVPAPPATETNPLSAPEAHVPQPETSGPAEPPAPAQPAAPPAEPSERIPVLDAVAPAPSAPPQTLEPEVINRVPPLGRADGIGIGIAWAARGVDLDLYVKPHPRAKELYYRQTVTPEGRYFHDYRNANLGVDYEWVELAPSVRLDQVSVWVNYYAGRVPNVAGKVCLKYGEKIMIRDFVIQAPHGNRGGQGQRRGQSPYWIEVKLLEILNAATNP